MFKIGDKVRVLVSKKEPTENADVQKGDIGYIIDMVHDKKGSEAYYVEVEDEKMPGGEKYSVILTPKQIQLIEKGTK
jgi:ATP-dependent exoDNAse (exonuclease V) alpha subunit